MGNSDNYECGLLSRTAKLLNNSHFSDVEFQVRNESNEYVTFHCHKLILAMAGSGFEALFYDKSDSGKSIKITEVNPHIFYLMIQYLYTDKLTIRDMKEAMDLLKLAKRYIITDLLLKCCTYIRNKQTINLDNFFPLYECALTQDVTELLTDLRKFASSNTKDVFKHNKFYEVSTEVLQDILRQDTLEIDNEMDIINTVIRWCKNDCVLKDRSIDKDGIRDAIIPFLPYIRFLTLSIEEFINFNTMHDLLKGSESSILTQKILMTNCDVVIPKGFCPIAKRRECYVGGGPRYMQALSTETTKERTNVVQSPHNYSRNNLFQFRQKSETVQQPSYIKTEPQPIYHRSTSTPAKKEEIPIYQFEPIKKQTPMLKVMPQIPSMQRRTFDFPLQEMQKEISFAVKKDIMSDAHIQMMKGSIMIHGIEMRVANQRSNSSESILIITRLSDHIHPPKCENHTLVLKDSLLSLTFSESLRIPQNGHLNIEITIDDLKLERCNVIKEQMCELNCGLYVKAGLKLSSNHAYGSDGIFFLISRIIYSSC